MKHKQSKRLFWERYIQEGTNQHRPAIDALKKIVRHKKKIRQALGTEISSQEFSRIEKLISVMSDSNSKFWKQLMDNEANEYLNAIAMLENVVENKKDITGEIAPNPNRKQIEQVIEIVTTMRAEIKEAAWISSRTKKTFKRALCEVMQNGVSDDPRPAIKQGQAKKSKSDRETITLF